MAKGDDHKKALPMTTKIGCALSSGGIASLIGNPADLCLVRMQADGLAPPEERRGYKNVGDALKRIVAEEGVTSLWRGCQPTIARAMALQTGMMATYDTAKEKIEPVLGNGFSMKLSAGLIAGFVASLFSCPFDMVKTRVQRAGPGVFTGPLDCATQLLTKEGPGAFYRGFPTYVMRIGPHSFLTLMFLEAATDSWRTRVLGLPNE